MKDLTLRSVIVKTIQTCKIFIADDFSLKTVRIMRRLKNNTFTRLPRKEKKKLKQKGLIAYSMFYCGPQIRRMLEYKPTRSLLTLLAKS